MTRVKQIAPGTYDRDYWRAEMLALGVVVILCALLLGVLCRA